MNAVPCSEVPVTVPAVDLAGETRQWVVANAAQAALETNTTLVIIGLLARDYVALCPDQCALFRPGVLVVVPDVDVLQLGYVPEWSERVEREDGRAVVVIPGMTR